MAAQGMRRLFCEYRLLTRMYCNSYYQNARCIQGTEAPQTSQDVKPPGKVKQYAVKKYVGHIDRLEGAFERKYPKAYKVYRVFKDGIKEFFNDTKLYYRVATDLWSGKNINTFTRAELENYRVFPRELLRMGPIVVLLNIPLIDTLLPPLLYFFPEHLLSRHFFTPEQRLQFGFNKLNRRIQHYPNIVQYLDKHSKDIKDSGHKKIFQDIMHKLDTGSHPEVEEILELKPLFVSKPFGLDYLARIHRIHLWHLAKGLGMSTRKQRLVQDVQLFHHIDLAMGKEGVSSLTLPEQQQACFVRGLNCIDVPQKELEDYLSLWVQISQKVDETSLSLLLHSPVLLAYNRPSNSKHIKKLVAADDPPGS